ncbi:MAG: hypothetical protein BWZ01_02175 [Deltaproteobacteria bacterium ADurb.BinA179]|nr:MAG: hypothetical protein BWZ01_02175 [Deltaproteobacteria bacterium ADurb.BinA179]
MPGTIPKQKMIAAAESRAMGWKDSCSESCLPMDLSAADWVTRMPAADEMISAGICETRPSPMVRVV